MDINVLFGKFLKSAPTYAHPDYTYRFPLWQRYRLTYFEPELFIDTYLRHYSLRESKTDFEDRKFITYLPAYAASCVDEIKNAIFQRIGDVTRKQITPSYAAAAAGFREGVDYDNSTIEEYIGQKILPELLALGKVGVLVDTHREIGATLYASQGHHPYFVLVPAEDILSWSYKGNELNSVLIRVFDYKIDEKTNLPCDVQGELRLYSKVDGKVLVRTLDEDLHETAKTTLEIPAIPFYIFDINESLLSRVARHQIALLNLASTAVSYNCKSNFPLYTEQVDSRVEESNRKIKKVDAEGKIIEDKEQSRDVGILHGRQYGKDLDRPDFIAPPTEPLTSNLSHQDSIKSEIRSLVNLSVAKLAQTKTTAESKSYDERDLEAGLSYIGLVLQKGERVCAKIWAMFEKQVTDPEIIYPKEYSLKTDEARQALALNILKTLEFVPSICFRRESAKIAAELLLKGHVSSETLQEVGREIDNAKVVVCNSDTLAKDFENGLVTGETASVARGYPAGEYDQAQKEKVIRTAAIVNAQNTAAARGNSDASLTPNKDAKEEKANSQDHEDSVQEQTQNKLT